MKVAFILGVVATLFFLMAFHVHGKGSSGITGTVTCSGVPTARAQVNIQNSSGIITRIFTGHNGVYSISLIPGNYFIALESDGPCIIPVDLYTPITVNPNQYTVQDYSF